MQEIFIREGVLLGEQALIKLGKSHVCVVGLGGVGGWCAEALARSGVGELTLIDSEDFSPSNINRQLGALHSTLGHSKAEVTAQRLQDINPALRLHAVKALYCAETRSELLKGYDYVADCIDLVKHKTDLIASCQSAGIPIISALGTGNKLDASLLEITDIAKTRGCPFARVMRKELRSMGIEHHRVVYSPEEPAPSLLESREAPPPGRRSIPGSLVWVPAAAGLLMAQEIVLNIAK